MAPLRGRRSRGTTNADVVVIGGGYTGMWTAWHLLDSEPGIRVLLLEGGVCGHGPSGRNGGFCESLWFSAPALRERFGDEAARALLDASSETVTAIGAWCEDNDVDAWFDQSGLPVRLDRRGVRRRGPRRGRGRRGAGRRRRRCRTSPPEEVRERVDSPVFRRGVFVPDFATVQPARLALGLRARLLERGVEIFENSRVRLPRCRRLGGGARRPAGRCAPRPPSSPSARRALVPAAPLAAVRDLLPHRADRAGARRARGDRLDRRRVHHRRPHAPPLLPHDARRADRVRLGRRPARLRRAPERPHRGGPRGGRRGAPPPAADLPRARGAPRSRTPGAARSTCRPATSPRSARCRAGPSTSPSASPATAWARRTWPAAPSPRWRSTGATAGRSLPLVGLRARAPGCRPSRSPGWAGTSSAARFLRREEAYERGEAARPAHARALRGAEGARDPRGA